MAASLMEQIPPGGELYRGRDHRKGSQRAGRDQDRKTTCRTDFKKHGAPHIRPFAEYHVANYRHPASVVYVTLFPFNRASRQRSLIAVT